MCLPVKPYKVEREWKTFGLSCAVVQNREAGNRCGYVRVPPGHPAWGKHYDDVDVDVHGGLTFARPEPCMEHEDGQGYWLGFDCAHSRDKRPCTDEFILAVNKKYGSIYGDGTYRDFAYVQAEVTLLAKQLHQMKKGE